MRVGEFAFAVAQSREIETQHSNAVNSQPLGDAFGSQIILATGEAVREQRIGHGLAEGQIEHRRQFIALGIGKIETLASHD